jgi:hypothetical protein
VILVVEGAKPIEVKCTQDCHLSGIADL